MTIEERWSTAIYEASHVIVGWTLGLPVGAMESHLPPALSIERATERARPAAVLLVAGGLYVENTPPQA